MYAKIYISPRHEKKYNTEVDPTRKTEKVMLLLFSLSQENRFRYPELPKITWKAR